LSVAQCQLVEIAKALLINPKILVLDEPTAPLSTKDVDRLMSILDSLRTKSISAIYISHRLEEIFRIADRVTVLKDGKCVGTVETKKASLESLIQMMLSRHLDEQFPKEKTEIGRTILEVKELSRENVFSGINFTLHSGEILGIAGLVGAKKTELARAIFGADQTSSGGIFIGTRKVKVKSPKAGISHGIALIPEDRRGQGLVPNLSVRDNITLANIKRWIKLGFIAHHSENSYVSKIINTLNIHTPHIRQRVKYLSGGNQQKVVLGRWMSSNSKIYIFDEPTNGIDVGSKVEIYKLMGDLARNGAGIILISEEISEVLGMSDRVLVMYRGQIVAEFDRKDATREKILFYAMGGADVEAVGTS